MIRATLCARRWTSNARCTGSLRERNDARDRGRFLEYVPGEPAGGSRGGGRRAWALAEEQALHHASRSAAVVELAEAGPELGIAFGVRSRHAVAQVAQRIQQLVLRAQQRTRRL